MRLLPRWGKCGLDGCTAATAPDCGHSTHDLVVPQLPSPSNGMGLNLTRYSIANIKLNTPKGVVMNTSIISDSVYIPALYKNNRWSLYKSCQPRSESQRKSNKRFNLSRDGFFLLQINIHLVRKGWFIIYSCSNILDNWMVELI